MGQLGFGFQCAAKDAEERDQVFEDELFLDAESHELFVGAQRLEAYLDDNGLGWVVRLAALLKELDYSAFARAYQPTGRRALHPRVMLGLVVYGILSRQWSLRELESLARRDVGAWWICGGHQPDHSTIGKFIQLHAELLSEEFFVGLVKSLIGKLRLAPGIVAGDGTVIEAAASHYRSLRAEAVIESGREAQAASAASPHDAELARRAALAQHAAALAEERSYTRGRHGFPGGVVLSPLEPEAVVQPRKDGVRRPSYKPTAMVHEAGLIVGQHVDPSSERVSVKPMLEQHTAAFGGIPATVLLDAGFASLAVLGLMMESEIDVLCPTGRAVGEEDWQRRDSHRGMFSKQAFRYLPEQDVYRCPACRELRPGWRSIDRFGRRYRVYLADSCDSCQLRDQCTTSSHGRMVRRYQGDDLKDLMAAVLSHPAARAKYRRRHAIVEPCFAQLRERQGLRRFHRRGLAAVRVEFALHCIAFNLKKAVGPLFQLLVLLVRLPKQPRRVLGVIALTGSNY